MHNMSTAQGSLSTITMKTDTKIMIGIGIIVAGGIAAALLLNKTMAQSQRTVLSLSAEPSSTVPTGNEIVAISGVLTNNGQPVTGQQVELFVAFPFDPNTWVDVGTMGLTDAGGNYGGSVSFSAGPGQFKFQTRSGNTISNTASFTITG
jgi:hypothetical protein